MKTAPYTVTVLVNAKGLTDETPAGISYKCGVCHAFAGLNHGYLNYLNK